MGDGIEDRIRLFIREELHHPDEPLARDDPLIERGVLDSLGIMNLVTFVESEYGVTVEDEELVPEHFNTIGDVADLVRTKRTPTG